MEFKPGNYIRILPTAQAHESYFGRVYRILRLDRGGSLLINTYGDPTVATVYFYPREVEPAIEEDFFLDRLMH